MARSGNESTHIIDGATIRALDVDKLQAGPNGAGWFFLPNIISPLIAPYPLGAGVAGAVFSANDARGVRCIVPRSGQLLELAVFVTVSNGNLDLGVYDCTATTRARLCSVGSTAVGTVNTWQVLAPTTLPNFTAGQAVDFAISTSSATATFLSAPALANAAAANLPAANWGPTYTDYAGATAGVTSGRMAWAIATSHPLPATLTEASLGTVASAPIILGRMAGS